MYVPSLIPPPPWRSAVDALVWVHAATPAAHEALPPELKARAGLPLTIGGLISYREGPVGPYGEVLGAPVMLRGRPLVTHVPFLGVDSEASIAAGRSNWALPKVRAVFDGKPGLPGLVSARGDGWELHPAEPWELHVRATARTRRLPFYMAARCVQVWPDGEVRELSMRIHGRARLARVEVQHGKSSSIDWLAEGRHAAVLISGVQDIFAPAPPPDR